MKLKRLGPETKTKLAVDAVTSNRAVTSNSRTFRWGLDPTVNRRYWQVLDHLAHGLHLARVLGRQRVHPLVSRNHARARSHNHSERLNSNSS